MSSRFFARGVFRAGCLCVAALFWAGGTASAETVFSLTREAADGGVYTPGGVLDITVHLDIVTSGTITAIGLEETSPEGWGFDSVVAGTVPSVQPFPGVSGLLEFSWFPLPDTYPIVFTYRLQVPEDAQGQQHITGNGVGRVLPDGAIVTLSVSTALEEPTFPVPNVVGLTLEQAEAALLQAGFALGAVTEEYSVPVAVDRVKRTNPAAGQYVSAGAAIALVLSLGQGAVHSGDYDQNGVISLTELLRLIQFFNVGGYHCPAGEITEDGYVPGQDGDHTCLFHNADTNEDWSINLGELLRLIQFFNTGGYHYCPDSDPPTEDGFCPGP